MPTLDKLIVTCPLTIVGIFYKIEIFYFTFTILLNTYSSNGLSLHIARHIICYNFRSESIIHIEAKIIGSEGAHVGVPFHCIEFVLFCNISSDTINPFKQLFCLHIVDIMNILFYISINK